MSRQQHLDRGSCCERGCVHCPWRLPVNRPPIETDPRIEAALRSGEPTVIFSDRQSLVRSVTLQNLTIIYKVFGDLNV
jgi:hypothetical protein